MYVMLRERLSLARARLTTGYRVTDDYCLELYHIISGYAVLNVKTQGEDNIEHIIATTTTVMEVTVL